VFGTVLSFKISISDGSRYVFTLYIIPHRDRRFERKPAMFIQIINFNIFDKNFTRASEEVGAVVSGCPVLENKY
jgi:hypothetical protein